MDVYRRQPRVAGLVLALALAAVPACRRAPPPQPAGPQLQRATRLLLGSTVTITAVAAGPAEQERAARLAAEALDEVRRVEGAAAAAPRTLQQVQRAAGQAPVHLGEDLFRLLTLALRQAETTGGAYDPTVGALRELYCNGARPTPAALKTQLGLVGHGHVRLTPQPPGFVGTVSLKHAGMRLDLDELWRPYAVDRAAQVLAHGGLEDFLVESVSVAAAKGARPDGPWRVSVDAPGNEAEWLARLFMKTGAVAVVDTMAVGRPASAGCAGVTVDPRTGLLAGGVGRAVVVAPDAVGAAALARAVVAAGPQAGPALLQRLGREGIVAPTSGPVWVSDGLRRAAVLRASDQARPGDAAPARDR
ncbi:MAG: FAD:protein FMN transferase [Deltaproteobacteria bacterium]|nr:FAD:protein FMN transferase [Deltaproteobacteria bacterium]